ncbi:inosine/uridine-preferring nucleoside hydrolase [Kipferlia bialata]|uniref:Inosine/uridine-preferring nucleoside hydrolase n=1 Tax=Kipferlia bialata TaxID=797122 RepID=A0A9K3GFF6_9EUKA|nr:inosine/uridine-preferring nucleoside hydrolase [Kipferlia bialata]GIQ82526.1 inosine/uridine-preferring nucleoside hydrolase [Kipferlia bialata]|eukprot:g927.t1
MHCNSTVLVTTNDHTYGVTFVWIGQNQCDTLFTLCLTMCPMGIHLWIDTDAGVDDCLALIAALTNPSVTVHGISCTYGNISRDAVVTNVRRTVRACQGVRPGLDAPPIYLGESRGLSDFNAQHLKKGLTPWSTGSADHDCWHGTDGLGGVPGIEETLAVACGLSLPPLPAYVEDTSVCYDALHTAATAVREMGETLRVVAIGPLTDMHHAALRHPDLPGLIHLYVMGCSFPELHPYCTKPILRGNMVSFNMPHTEHNTACDPEASASSLSLYPCTVVDWALTALNPLTMGGYDALHGHYPYTPGTASKGVPFLTQFHRHVSEHLRGKCEPYGEFQICDPLAVLVAMDGTLVEGSVRGECTVNTSHEGVTLPVPKGVEMMYGRSVLQVDTQGSCEVVTKVDYDTCVQTLKSALEYRE